MRRQPGPADYRPGKGGNSGALYELFRDWQRTTTQSSAKALLSRRQQMDVRSCWKAGTTSREALVRSIRS
jgi:hypothetical protein